VRIVGYHISEDTIADTDGGAPDGLTFLEYLLKPKKDAIRIFFHLEYGIANLLRMARITEGAGRELLLTTNLHIPPYRLRYIPYKLFSIKRSGAFSYFSNASQYISFSNSMLSQSPTELAQRAKEVGEKIYETLNSLGLEATSLINPIRAYEKKDSLLLPIEQINWLYKEKEVTDDTIKKQVIQRIICGIAEKDLDTSNGSDKVTLVTLSTAIRKNKWNKLGRLI